MAGDQDRAPLGRQRPQEPPQPADALRVQPVRRLVEHEKPGLDGQRPGELDALERAEGQAGDGTVGEVGQALRFPLEAVDRVAKELDTRDACDVARGLALDGSFGCLFTEIGLTPSLMATGGRGYHVVAPLDRSAGFDEARALARAIADRLIVGDPDGLTVDAEGCVWQFLNPACRPNAAVMGRRLVAIREIAAGEEVTFNYNCNEYDMESPFRCRCGDCEGVRVRGYRYLSAADRERLGQIDHELQVLCDLRRRELSGEAVDLDDDFFDRFTIDPGTDAPGR